jgi:hypothetical protein
MHGKIKKKYRKRVDKTCAGVVYSIHSQRTDCKAAGFLRDRWLGRAVGTDF